MSVVTAGSAMMPLLDGEIALVTGAGRGIGRAVAIELAAGADLALLARSVGQLDETAGMIRDRACAAEVFPADVDVEADHGAVDDESAGAERSAGGEAGGKTVGDLLLGGREVGLAEVEALRDGGVRPRLEVNVPNRAFNRIAPLVPALPSGC